MKPNLLPAVAAVLVGVLSGCASVSRPIPAPPERCWTEPEQRGDRIRFYPNIEEDQALRAAERLLRLAGRDDMKIVRSKHTMIAEYHRERRFYLFLVAHQSSVWDHWIVAVRPAAGGVDICVHVRGQYFTDTFVFGAEPVHNAVYPANATEQDPGKFFKPPARAFPIDFGTFWDRLDYLLEQNPNWAACRYGGYGGVRNNELRTRLEWDPLCHSLIADPSPPSARGADRLDQ